MTTLEILKNKNNEIQNLNWLKKVFSDLSSHCDWLGVKLIKETTHHRSFRNGKPDENFVKFDQGLMIEILHDGYFSYSGTCFLDSQNIKNAFDQALSLAIKSAKESVYKFTPKERPKAVGSYKSLRYQDLDSMTLSELVETLRISSEKLKVSDSIQNATSYLRIVECEHYYINSSGTELSQNFLKTGTQFKATAQDGSEIQSRSDVGGLHRCYQSGLEIFDKKEIYQRCETIGKQALELLQAENCPTDTRDMILAPDQMYIQIHESIGHPLELDRILGDERNFAGWSFVRPNDFGKLKYGSKILNVTFDPTVPGEHASYAFDEAGSAATKEYLIKDGLLQRGLGSTESQARLNLPGVANFRSSSWNRAPIDRMANINVEPGDSSLKEMISQTEKGIYIQSNVSWSIDDYRNKFQFGSEYAQLIENGKLTKTVKNPNYRGQTIPFWNSLKAVGNAHENEMYGSPFCGKGEPSQIIRVGHASPPCLFENIEIFGGSK
jgi:predicted Zn-dependent protease